jgi:urease accessory protein
VRLLQLASPALPVGAYSYSQGLESAVESGVVRDEHSAGAWIDDALTLVMARFEGPMLSRMLEAVERRDADALHMLNAQFIASRETAELRAETVQMGRSLCRLLGELQQTQPVAALIAPLQEPSYPCAWACAAVALELAHDEAYTGYLWSWAENQVLAAIKLVPLGQSAGQRILVRLSSRIALLAAAPCRDDDWLANFAPGLAIASSRHETQYSRLFRS